MKKFIVILTFFASNSITCSQPSNTLFKAAGNRTTQKLMNHIDNAVKTGIVLGVTYQAAQRVLPNKKQMPLALGLTSVSAMTVNDIMTRKIKADEKNAFMEEYVKHERSRGPLSTLMQGNGVALYSGEGHDDAEKWDELLPTTASSNSSTNASIMSFNSANTSARSESADTTQDADELLESFAANSAKSSTNSTPKKGATSPQSTKTEAHNLPTKISPEDALFEKVYNQQSAYDKITRCCASLCAGAIAAVVSGNVKTTFNISAATYAVFTYFQQTPLDARTIARKYELNTRQI